MKYKIKVKVMQNGKCYYFPIVKKHWYTPWMYITGYNKTEIFTTRDGCYSRQDAIRLINSYKAWQLDHVYYIPYKEENELL